MLQMQKGSKPEFNARTKGDGRSSRSVGRGEVLRLGVNIGRVPLKDCSLESNEYSLIYPVGQQKVRNASAGDALWKITSGSKEGDVTADTLLLICGRFLPFSLMATTSPLALGTDSHIEG